LRFFDAVPPTLEEYLRIQINNEEMEDEK